MEANDDQVVRQVTERIDSAIKENRKHEYLLVVVLILLFVVGLGLLVYGAVTKELWLLAPGGILQSTIVFPILLLVKLREDNMRLQILPQLMRLADTEEAKRLAAKLVNRLIEQVK